MATKKTAETNTGTSTKAKARPVKAKATTTKKAVRAKKPTATKTVRAKKPAAAKTVRAKKTTPKAAPTPAPVPPEERSQLIAVAAYLRAESRGFTNGNEVEDWLFAEREVDARLSGQP